MAKMMKQAKTTLPATTGPDVVAVNRQHSKLLLCDGRQAPVTHWFGTDGNLCDPKDAVTCVGGSDEIRWYCVDLREFCYATVH